jgi:hypothetical protein
MGLCMHCSNQLGFDPIGFHTVYPLILRIRTSTLNNMQILVETSISVCVHVFLHKVCIKPYDPNPVHLAPIQAHAKWWRLQILHIRHNTATAVHTRRHFKSISFINVSSKPNPEPSQNALQAVRAIQLPYLHPGCCWLSLSAPTSLHRNSKAGTDGPNPKSAHSILPMEGPSETSGANYRAT